MRSPAPVPRRSRRKMNGPGTMTGREVRRSVLLVDDEFEFRNAVGEALHDAGWHVRGAATGIQALAVLQRWTPDVILLDLKLPAMDGWEFVAEAERQNAIQGIPLVIMSARMDPRTEVMKLGADAALAKPIDLDELQAVLDALTAA
jgi:CheY-like chemotaxis protein